MIDGGVGDVDGQFCMYDGLVCDVVVGGVFWIVVVEDGIFDLVWIDVCMFDGGVYGEGCQGWVGCDVEFVVMGFG